MCSHVFTPSHTPTHLSSQVSSHAHTCSSHIWLFPSPVLTHAQICLRTILPKCIPINKVTLKTITLAHKYTLTVLPHSRAATLVETRSEISHLTQRPLLPQQAQSQAHPTGMAPPLCTPPHPTHQHIHSYTPAAAESSTSRAPRPHNLSTPTGSCLKLLRLPSPSARRGPLSGYQEVKGECQEGGSSPLPVR